jgi:hypothetical protein
MAVARLRPSAGRLFIGLLVGGAFSISFVLANAHSPLGERVVLALRAVAATIFVAVIVLCALRAPTAQDGEATAFRIVAIAAARAHPSDP